MFQSYLTNEEEKQESKPKSKIITFMLNGHPQRIFEMEISNKKGITKQEIFKGIEKNWTSCVLTSNNSTSSTLVRSQSSSRQVQFRDPNILSKTNKQYQYHNFTLKNLRIFSIDAVQYFDEDLQYVKHGDRYYISNGQQFDNNSNFGEYQIIQKLGEGGFGSVNLAKNIITNQYAAIKILKPGKRTNSNDIDMIFKQAENLKVLNHPNIVKILNCYALSDMRVIIVMEYLEGGELLALLKKQKNGRFQQKEAKYYFRQIISGVGYCHRRGIIHRDLKLENILIKNNIQDDGKQSRIMKIADFGISGVADRFNPQVDWGTLRYMSPEVLAGKMKLNSPAVDVWACGVILYHLVTGKYPFDGNSSSQIYQSIIKKPLQFPTNILLTIKCKNLIKEMLQKDPNNRITINDIEDHPWINANFTAITLPEDQWNLKTSGSCDDIPDLASTEGIYNGFYINQYDAQDIKRISKADLIKLKTKRSFHKNTSLKQQHNNRGGVHNRKSIHFQNDGNNIAGLIRIPKRLQKQRDEIIEELKSYKQFRQKNINKDNRQIIKDREKNSKKYRYLPNNYNHKYNYNYHDEINQKQKDSIKQSRDKKLFPIINNKKNNKFIVNLKREKEKQKSFQSSFAEKL